MSETPEPYAVAPEAPASTRLYSCPKCYAEFEMSDTDPGACPECGHGGGADFIPSQIRCRVWNGEAMRIVPFEEVLWHNDRLLRSSFFHVPTSALAWMLSTGLRDADGREVFDGDILSTWKDPSTAHKARDLGRVEMGSYEDEDGEERYGWHLRDLPGGDLSGEAAWPLSVGFVRDFRVVGHVYEGTRDG